MPFFLKKSKKPETLIDFTSTQFNNNSSLVNFSVKSTKKIFELSINGTKKLIGPVSKFFDYGVVSLCSVILYNLIFTKNIINY